MKTLFVQIKCEPGRAYEVAGEVVEIEQVSEVHSTSGQYDLLVKCHLADETDPGRFVCETIQRLDGIADTYTLVGYKAF